MEAASYSLATHPDPDLEAQVDDVADKIICAQQPDGYLNTHFIRHPAGNALEEPARLARDVLRRSPDRRRGGAFRGHRQAQSCLNALSRYADHIDAKFGPEPGKKRGYPGHPELELALVRLYHATGNKRYLELASYFIDERGTLRRNEHYYDLEARERGDDPAKFWARAMSTCQAHEPIREQEKVVGHAVRAMYLFSAVADLADECDDASLLETCDRLWDNLINQAHVPDRRDWPIAPQRRLYRRLRPARRDRLCRNLRDDRAGDVEPAPAAVRRRAPFRRRDGARTVQRFLERRFAGAASSSIMRTRFPAPATTTTWSGSLPLLPAQRGAHDRQHWQLLLLNRPERTVGAPVCREYGRSRVGGSPVTSQPGDALSMGWCG